MKMNFARHFSAVVIRKPSLNPCQVKAQIVAVEVLKMDRLKNLSVDLETKRQEAETLECQKREMHDRKKTVRKKEAARIRQGKGKVLLIFNSN